MFLRKLSRIAGVFILILLFCGLFAFRAQKSKATVQVKAAPAEKMAVTPVGYDDIGDILKQLNISADTIEESDLKDLAKLKQYEVVYINCSSGVDYISAEAAPVVSQYVKEGGIVYASDYTNSLIQDAFPGKINFYGQSGSSSSYSSPRVGSSGSVTAKVVDSGLASVLGKNKVNINFDLGSWVVIDSAGSGTKVHVTGPASVFASDDSQAANKEVPYVVSFSEGSGEVLYTSFHNEAQKTGDMENLVNWFAIRTRASNLARITEELASEGGKTVLQEVVDKINQGETKEYAFQATGKKDFSIVLNFGGSAIKLTLTDPKGKKVASEDVSAPPYSTNISAKEGKYTIKLEGNEIPSANYPFVLTVSGDKEAIAAATFEDQSSQSTSETAKVSIFDYIKKIATYAAVGLVVVAVLIIVVVVAVKRRKKISPEK